MHGESSSAGVRDRVLTALCCTALVLYVMTVLRAGWTGDDAFISMRAADNLVHGYGLLSNPPERVLGFTNPLWTLLLCIPLALGLSGYAAAIASGVVVSTAAAVVVLFRATRRREAALVAGLWLIASAAYIDYSTSGLENPLAHFLLGLFFTRFFAGRLDPARLAPWALAAAIVLNRQDHAILIAPALASLLFEPGSSSGGLHLRLRRPFKPVARAIALGLAPFGAWLLFALVYYGFPFPNTVYAKLNLQLPPGVLGAQGLVYFKDSLLRDPITLVLIVAALIAAAFERSRAGLAASLGIALYLGYVVRIGGDFMSGRFFTAPFLIAVLWLAASALSRAAPRVLFGIGCASLLVLACFPVSYRTVKRSDCVIGTSGIASERHCYSDYTALVDNFGTGKYMQHGRWQRGVRLRRGKQRVLASTNVGMMGFVAGPNVHIVDLMALTEPLLARIPYRSGSNFRIGHFQRELPRGYLASIESGENQLEDPCLRAYYAQLKLVIYGPLWSAERFSALLDLNRGRYDALVRERCRLPARGVGR